MSSLFGGGSTTVVQAPTPLPPPTMPDPNSPANLAAGQLQQRQNQMRDGRMASILTTPGSRPPTIAGGSLGASKQSGGQGAGGAAPSFSNVSL
jgi:hypothetical protein